MVTGDLDLLLVHARFYIIVVNTDTNLTDLISDELETEEIYDSVIEELKAGHIYLEKTPAEIKNDDKFMALDKVLSSQRRMVVINATLVYIGLQDIYQCNFEIGTTMH